MQQIKYRKLSEIKLLPNNPRFIKDKQFETLCRSIGDNPEYFEARPIILSDRTGELIIIAGNQRYRAAEHIKLKQVPTYLISGLTEEKEQEIIIRDNISNGDWDWDKLANEWDVEQLSDWGLDINKAINSSEKGEEIQIEKSLQVIPKKEYVIIIADESSDDWSEIKRLFKCKTVRQGGCKVGSNSDNNSIGIERVFDLKTFKERIGI